MRRDDARGVGGGDAREQRTDEAERDDAPDELATTKPGTDEGAMPANVFEHIRPITMAGFAKLVQLAKKYAAPM